MNATSNHDTERSKHGEGLSGITNCHRSAPYACRSSVSTLTSVAARAAVRHGTSSKWSAKCDDETHLGLVRRARRMNRTLAQAFPHVYCELDFTNPLELTVATILSAQSTDKGVNLTTPALFAKYRTALDYAEADRDRARGAWSGPPASTGTRPIR